MVDADAGHLCNRPRLTSDSIGAPSLPSIDADDPNATFTHGHVY